LSIDNLRFLRVVAQNSPSGTPSRGHDRPMSAFFNRAIKHASPNQSVDVSDCRLQFLCDGGCAPQKLIAVVTRSGGLRSGLCLW
jgi:hypothetical protein